MEDIVNTENAVAYGGSQDKWVFCLELLGLSITADGEDKCDSAIEDLERRFELLLMRNGR